MTDFNISACQAYADEAWIRWHKISACPTWPGGHSCIICTEQPELYSEAERMMRPLARARAKEKFMTTMRQQTITWDDECCNPIVDLARGVEKLKAAHEFVDTLPVQERVSSLLLRESATWLLIVAGGILQVPAVRAAHKLGYKVVVTDQNPECACAGLADHFEQLSTFDVAGHVDFVQRWRNETGAPLAAVFTAGADPVVTVAFAADIAGCHGILPRIAKVCADKAMTRNTLDGLGLQPEWAQVWDDCAIQLFARNRGKAAYIVKATGSSGSRGHTRGTAENFQSKKFCTNACALARKFSGARDVLIEELLTGVELSVETLWYDGSMIPLNAVERPFMPDTNIELGHYNPAVLLPKTWRQVWSVMQLAGDAIGIDATQGGHILKGDLILTDDGPKVLELTMRLSGGFDSGWTSPLAHGVDYTRGALKLSLGWPLHKAMPDFAPRWNRHVVCLAVFAEPGVVKAVRGVKTVESYRDGKHQLIDTILRYNVGDTVPELVDCTQRAAFVIANSSDHKAALNMARWARDTIKYEMK